MPVSSGHKVKHDARFTVAEWLTHSPAMLEATGSRLSFGDISENNLSNQYSLQHKVTVWHCRNCYVSGQNKRLSPEGHFQDLYINALLIYYD